jgi:hypothetical protein
MQVPAMGEKRCARHLNLAAPCCDLTGDSSAQVMPWLAQHASSTPVVTPAVSPRP